jgi:hypothetical protein
MMDGYLVNLTPGLRGDLYSLSWLTVFDVSEGGDDYTESFLQ